MNRLVTIVTLCLVAAPALAADKRNDKRIDAAREALKASLSAPDKSIPQDLLRKAKCIGVFPGVAKGAFVVGGEYGHGVFTCREQDGAMGPPAFFKMGGASVGWQFGAREADFVLLIMNDDGLNHLLADRFTLGGEASVAAGPVGRTAAASTDAQLHAQILTWSRSRGVFLGAAFDGTVISPDAEATRAFYGKPLTARQILIEGDASTPQRAQAFVKLANEYAGRTL